MVMRRNRALRLAGPLMILLCLGVAGCAPELPDAPAEGYILVPRSFAARLDADAGAGAYADSAHMSLQRLLVESRAATARQVGIEVTGRLSVEQQFAITGEIRASAPYAAVTFHPGSETPPFVTIHYLEAIPKSCFARDSWVGVGYLPAGCASSLSAARAVSDPRDLVMPSPMGPAPLEPLVQDAIRYTGQAGNGASGSTQTPAAAAPAAH